MVQQKKKHPADEDLKEIILPTDSNALDFVVPSTTLNFSDNTPAVKIGAKATITDNEAKQFEYQQRLRESQHILQDPTATREFILAAAERRRAMEAAAVESRIAFEQKRAFEIAEKKEKERQAAYELMLQNENETHRQMRLAQEKQKKEERQKILDKMLRDKQRQLEKIEVFMESSENSFVAKYQDNAIDSLADSPVARIISSREFGTNRFGNQKFAYRCTVCKYNNEESLILATIHRHIFNYNAKHKRLIGRRPL